MSSKVLAHSAGPLAEHHERDEDADEDVEEGQPEQAHAQLRSHATEADDGRRAHEGRTVRERHHGGVHVPTRQQVVGRGARRAVPQISQIRDRHQVDGRHDEERWEVGRARAHAFRPGREGSSGPSGVGVASSSASQRDHPYATQSIALAMLRSSAKATAMSIPRIVASLHPVPAWSGGDDHGSCGEDARGVGMEPGGNPVRGVGRSALSLISARSIPHRPGPPEALPKTLCASPWKSVGAGSPRLEARSNAR